ncbi:MAG: type VI secretion system-associated FHA domain protein TagH, partial [Steroidobacteraceae bacterium]
PVARAAPSPAASSTPHPELGAAPGLDQGARELLTALGLDARAVEPAIAAQLGDIVRTVVEGMIEVLRARAEVKNNFRMSMTSVRVVENNPLKFSLNADDALHNLFVKRNPGYLGPLEAFREGFQDIAFHELAMLAGIRAAYQSMVSKFSPAHLEETYSGNLRRNSVLPIGGRPKLWDMYCAQFGNIEKDSEGSFQLLFGEEFAKAYHKQLERLSQAAKLHKKQTGA